MNKLTFIHSPSYTGKGGSTIAFQYNKTDKGKEIKFTIGFCSHKDNYSKKLGRDAALKQWVNGNIITIITKNKERDCLNKLYLIAHDLKAMFDTRI